MQLFRRARRQAKFPRIKSYTCQGVEIGKKLISMNLMEKQSSVSSRSVKRKSLSEKWNGGISSRGAGRAIRSLAAVLIGVSPHLASPARAADDPALLDIERKVTHGYATNEGVRIHYARLGKGPLVVMIHGFPDCWLTWRAQMEALAKNHEVVAIDQRGYNLSDRPKGAEKYDISLLVADVAAVIRERGRERAVIVGHDWGGMVAWAFAMTRPEMTEKLVILTCRIRAGCSTSWQPTRNSKRTALMRGISNRKERRRNSPPKV